MSFAKWALCSLVPPPFLSRDSCSCSPPPILLAPPGPHAGAAPVPAAAASPAESLSRFLSALASSTTCAAVFADAPCAARRCSTGAAAAAAAPTPTPTPTPPLPPLCCRITLYLRAISPVDTVAAPRRDRPDRASCSAEAAPGVRPGKVPPPAPAPAASLQVPAAPHPAGTRAAVTSLRRVAPPRKKSASAHASSAGAQQRTRASLQPPPPSPLGSSAQA